MNVEYAGETAIIGNRRPGESRKADMNRGRMMNEHEAHERDMQWDDAGDGAGLPETGERDAVQALNRAPSGMRPNIRP